MAVPAVTASRPATMADIDALPADQKGEIIDGVLYAMTRPRAAHQYLARQVATDVSVPFDRAHGGPGGWWILPEPGIELPGSPEVSPDVAGWRRERLLTLPRDRSINVVPDWVCEVMSPTTRRHHYLVKRPFYARVGVAYLWELNSDDQTLTVYHLENGHWVDVGAFADETAARVPPFEGVAFDVKAWWLGDAG